MHSVSRMFEEREKKDISPLTSVIARKCIHNHNPEAELYPHILVRDPNKTLLHPSDP